MSGIQQALLGAGASGPGVELPVSISVSDVEIAPTDAVATFTIRNTGAYDSVGNESAPSGTWLLAGAAADYDVRFTTTDSPTGALTNTWLNLGTSRAWTCTDTTQTAGGPVTAAGTLELSRAGLATVIESCSLSISASKEPA